MKYCKTCVMPDTRPRISYDEDGVCIACQWDEEKKTVIDWAARRQEFVDLCDAIRGKSKYDCIVPVSGGKDSSYVAYKLKHEFGLNILTVTVTPPLESDIIKQNLTNFLSCGYENIKVTPNPIITQMINKKGFVEQGRPLLSWTICLNTVMSQIATMMRIPLIMFGEEGESEYGGTTRLRYTPYYDFKDTIEIYNEGNDPAKLAETIPAKELTMWSFPKKEELEGLDIKVAHWSYYEDWDPFVHYVLAKEKVGLKEKDNRSVGPYNNFAQMDTVLYDLHTYMMYLKFGFGRCLQDVCIDIRKGRLTREEGVELVRKYDGEFIGEYIPTYLEYYQMTREEFDAALDRHANKELFEKKDGIWTPKFKVE